MNDATTNRCTNLYLESDMDAAELIGLAGQKVAVLCRRCPGKQEPNDDSAAVMQTEFGAVVLMVADGVGGCPQGNQASSIAIKSVAENVQSCSNPSELRIAILDGIERANLQILEQGLGSATTLTVVEICDRSARVYQIGDSTALIVGQRGAMKWKSTSHSPVGYAIESGLLDESEAMYHDERHVVSNLMGTRTMHIEVGPTRNLAARDTIILGSDGLCDNLHLDEVIEIGRSGKLLSRIEALAKLATTRMMHDTPGQPGKPDDLSIILCTQ